MRIFRKEWLLLGAVTAVTLTVSLAGIRWLAPQLLGIPLDLQTVRVGAIVAPFYEGIFRREDYLAPEFMLADPYTRVRPKPLYPNFGGIGPHDLLGFRNQGVPRAADVVTIGDSQTYGNNAALEDNWPSQLQRGLAAREGTVYSMAVGGWGPVQYMDMFANAVLLAPRVVVIAFYTGNDPVDAYHMAYDVDRFAPLRPGREVGHDELLALPQNPRPGIEHVEARFRDGDLTVFTPHRRLVSNDRKSDVVRAGLEITAAVVRNIASEAERVGTQVLFTIVPTKELAFAPKVREEGLALGEPYQRLVEHESLNVAELREAIEAAPGAIYVDVVAPLQQAVRLRPGTYPEDTNGHPIAAGYHVVGRAIAVAVAPLLPDPVRGLVSVREPDGRLSVFLASAAGVRRFPNLDILRANGWQLTDAATRSRRDIATRPLLGSITRAWPERFGPMADLELGPGLRRQASL